MCNILCTQIYIELQFRSNIYDPYLITYTVLINDTSDKYLKNLGYDLATGGCT